MVWKGLRTNCWPLLSGEMGQEDRIARGLFGRWRGKKLTCLESCMGSQRHAGISLMALNEIINMLEKEPRKPLASRNAQHHSVASRVAERLQQFPGHSFPLQLG